VKRWAPTIRIDMQCCAAPHRHREAGCPARWSRGMHARMHAWSPAHVASCPPPLLSSTPDTSHTNLLHLASWVGGAACVWVEPGLGHVSLQPLALLPQEVELQHLGQLVPAHHALHVEGRATRLRVCHPSRDQRADRVGAPVSITRDGIPPRVASIIWNRNFPTPVQLDPYGCTGVLLRLDEDTSSRSLTAVPVQP
jgi:hypothetical protein